MSSNSFAVVKLATAKLKMKMLPAGFPVALCSTALQFYDRHSNRSFLLRIADFVVDAVDVVDVSAVSVSEIVAFPPGEHLAFSDITYTLGKIVSSPIFIFTKSVPELSDFSEESSAGSSDEFLSQFLHQSAKAP